jgi:hypothetical protein
MMDKTGSAVPNEKLNAWIKQHMDSAVRELMDLGLAEGVIVEAKPAWVFPFTLLIGRLREHGQLGGFDWFICGDAPTSHVSSTVAATPREAARHFALQWQIDAARQGDAGEDLARKAEALYELVEQDSLWEQMGSE